MTFEIRERIVILTSEKWVDKHAITKRIASAYPGEGTVIHFSSLRRKYEKKLGSDFTEEKLSAYVLEHVARAISSSLLSRTYLILDTDIDDIPGYETLLHTIERILMLIDEMKDELDDFKEFTHGPIHVLHLSVTGTDAEKATYLKECRMNYRDAIYLNMGKDAEILADLLTKEKTARLERAKNDYAGLVFKKYYTFSSSLEISQATIKTDEELSFTVNL